MGVVCAKKAFPLSSNAWYLIVAPEPEFRVPVKVRSQLANAGVTPVSLKKMSSGPDDPGLELLAAFKLNVPAGRAGEPVPAAKLLAILSA